MGEVANHCFLSNHGAAMISLRHWRGTAPRGRDAPCRVLEPPAGSTTTVVDGTYIAAQHLMACYVRIETFLWTMDPSAPSIVDSIRSIVLSTSNKYGIKVLRSRSVIR